MDTFGLVILAAGKGKRLKTSFPKPLAPILGKTLVDCVVRSVKRVLPSSPFSFVIGHEKELVESHIKSQSYFNKDQMEFVFQEQQNGTGHALKMALENSLKIQKAEYIIVLCADTPCLSSELFEKMIAGKKDFDALVVTFKPENPFGYGRVFDDGKGKVSIVEEKEASESEAKHEIVNSGIYIFKRDFLLKTIGNLNNENASNEFYLTDLMSFTDNAGSILATDPMEFIGVNDLVQLNQAENYLRKNKLHQLMLGGVVIKDIETTSIDLDVTIASDSIIHPNVEILGNTTIGAGSLVERGSIIRDSQIGNSCVIKANSYIDQSLVSDQVKIGPMAQLRPGSQLGHGTKIGNFVELKKAKLDEQVSVSHLSYVGDAEIGAGSNLGCGFVSCNYDGANKSLTKIGKNTFIGSDSQMVAPVNIGDNCYVASGSTINQDMPDGSFAIARSRQVTKEGMARKFLKKKK